MYITSQIFFELINLFRILSSCTFLNFGNILCLITKHMGKVYKCFIQIMYQSTIPVYSFFKFINFISVFMNVFSSETNVVFKKQLLLYFFNTQGLVVRPLIIIKQVRTVLVFITNCWWVNFRSVLPLNVLIAGAYIIKCN